MKNLFALLFFGLLITALSCEKDQEFTDLQDKTTAIQQDVLSSQNQEFIGELPPATVERKNYTRKFDRYRNGECVNPLSPTSVELTLVPGETYIEEKEACVPAIPPKADVLYSFDLTGSMGDELNNVILHCDNIAQSIVANIASPRIAVVSHMDYDGDYPYDCANPGSLVTYGDFPPDYAYSRDIGFSSDITGAVHNTIEDLTLGNGWDGPEDYARVLWETYNDPSFASPTTGWRDDAAKIIIAWLDNVPHDCDDGTGPDPGRNGIAFDGDDIDFDAVIADLAARQIHLAVVFSGGASDLAYWQALEGPYLSVTPTDFDGTIPGTLIEDLILDIIAGTTTTIDELTLSVVEPAYEDWVTIDPESIADPATDGTIYGFDVTFEVPIDAVLGEHNFRLILERDGEFLAYQYVTIIVVPKYVPVDIKPTSCRNPLNMKSGGVVSVAINGYEDLDVTTIDPASVRLEGVEPLRWNTEDVSTPYWPFIGKVEAFDCTEEGPDRFDDLVFKFNKKELIEAFDDAYGPFNIGDVIVAELKGFTKEGVPIYGEDVMQVNQLPKAPK